MAINPAGTLVYVTSQSAQPGIVVIDAATNTVTSTISLVGSGLTDVAFSPDGTLAYATDQGGPGSMGQVDVIDTSTGTVTSTISINNATAVAFNAAGTVAYVADGFNSVYAISVATSTVSATISGFSNAQAVAASSAPATSTPVPTVTGISPSTGSVDGNTTVTITGTGLTGASEVDFGPGNPGTNLSCASDTSCTVTTPAEAAGTVDVQVVNPGGTSATSSADQYTFAPDLAVTLTGPSGPVAAGTAYTYTGTVTNLYGQPSSAGGAYISLSAGGPGENITAFSDSAGDTCTALSGQFGYCLFGGGSGLATGASVTVSVTVVPNTFGTVSATFSSGFAFFGGIIPTATATTTTTVTGPDPTATITGPTNPVPAGAPYTYTETVTNQADGIGDATNVTADPTLNPAAGDTAASSITAATTSQGTCTLTTTTSAACALGTLAPGASAAITITVLPTTPGTVSIGDNPSADNIGVFATPSDTTTVVVAAPAVTGISPHAGPLTGGTVVTITGTNLANPTAVTFGADGPATAISCTATSCSATAPAGTAGTVDVQVTTAGGTSATSSSDQYTYTVAPVITAISPTAGPLTGGTVVTITGTGLAGATSVTFGTGHPATAVSCTATTCTATAPAGTAGAVDVQVTTVGGTSATSTADKYTYDAVPTVTAVSPTAGPATGGTVVTITGTGLTGATSVTFGTGHPATAVSCTTTTCTATAPAGTAGVVDVQVSTPGGTSATSAADKYTYVAAPTVTAISPNAGPLAAGTHVTITGTNLTGATSVTFGTGHPATGVTCTATSCTVTAPAGTAGTVDVQVTTIGGTSATSAADKYTYDAVPTVTAVTPNAGPSGGGTHVTITGTNLTGATVISFGVAGNATAVSCTSSTTCTATTPAWGTGTVDVLVTTPGGTSAAVSGDKYTYVAAPTITKISPTSGPSVGGTKVTITGTNLTGATITFGTGNPATAVTCTATSCTATAPAEAPGTVDVQATTPGGTSATSSADKYTYTASSDLAVTLAGNPNPAALGGYGTITATVTDLGPQTATVTAAAVTFTGANAAILKVTPSQGTCTVDTTHRTVTCALGTVTTTTHATIAITVEPDATGTLTTTAGVLGLPWDPNLTNNAAALNTTVANSHGCTTTGTTGNDKINATGHQIICGLGGNDTINAGTGGGSIYLGSGNDTVTGGSGTETVYGGLGTDTVNAGSGANDVVYAGDYLYPGTGVPAATINGGTGHTTCYVTTADHVTGCAVIIH